MNDTDKEKNKIYLKDIDQNFCGIDVLDSGLCCQNT